MEKSGRSQLGFTVDAAVSETSIEIREQMEPVLCYESRNLSCLRTIYPLSIRITLYLILGATVILTVCGNLLVTVSIAYFKQLHTPTNYLIASLAVSDLLLGLLVMFPSMIRCVETCWYFGDVFCKVYMSSDVTLCTASILNLSFISLDRHVAVCQPLLYRRKITVNVVLIMILLSWSVSALIGFGMIFLKLNILGIEEFYYHHVMCEGGCVLFQSGLSSTVSSVLSFYIPGIIMLGVYLKIFLVAQRQLRSIHNASSAKISSTAQTKATKTLAIIMGAFLSFWTPFFVCNIIDPFISYSTPPAVFETLVWVGYLNSTVNPLIYAFFYSWFRKAFRLFISGNVFKSDMSETTLFTE
ncbi:trace amine-associated receptor 1-like [Toxotes jaculatrix]|uniref:trace amine-associated receptor 1-like n=1 Tax=Toxotes jaculatrix TaxID=941984 RepID=UPI001B3AB181|nr:trace amine-associated receptor 1-like [Toxotes jaculatrix]